MKFKLVSNGFSKKKQASYKTFFYLNCFDCIVSHRKEVENQYYCDQPNS
jgi:hypothetical protein